MQVKLVSIGSGLTEDAQLLQELESRARTDEQNRTSVQMKPGR